MQNYTLQVTVTEDGTLALRVSENFYRTLESAPITEHHRLSLAPGQSMTADQLADNVGAARKDWDMVTNGDHTRMGDVINAVCAIIHTPQVKAAYAAKVAAQRP